MSNEMKCPVPHAAGGPAPETTATETSSKWTGLAHKGMVGRCAQLS